MGGQKAKTQEDFTKKEDLTEHDKAEKTGYGYGEEEGTREDTGRTHTETTAERQQREASEARSRTTGGAVGRTTTGGETRNEYGWGDAMPETERSKAVDASLKEAGELGDPTIPFREARAKQDALRMVSNPVDAFSTPESRRAITQQLFSNIGQQAGQDYLTQAFNRSQQKLQAAGLQTQMFQYMSPKRELLGSKQTAATDTSQQTTQDTVSNTLSEMFGVDKSHSDAFSQNLMKTLQSNFNIDFNQVISDAQKSATSSGNSTTVQSTPFNWGSLIGGLLGVATTA